MGTSSTTYFRSVLKITKLVWYTVLPLSVSPSKIFFVTFFSATIDGKNLIFDHKLHIGMPYRGKRFWNHQIPTS
jgi:hypothetical protein